MGGTWGQQHLPSLKRMKQVSSYYVATFLDLSKSPYIWRQCNP